MSAVMYVVLKSWVISTGVMFVNWGDYCFACAQTKPAGKRRVRS